MSENVLAEAATYTKQTHAREEHPCPDRDSNPRSQQSSGFDLRLRHHGHRCRHKK